MIVALILAGAIIFVGVLLYLHDRMTRPRPGVDAGTSDAAGDVGTANDEGCCGMHITCERDSLSTALSDGKIVYYDDEELDIFRDRQPDSYTADEIEMFREILLTMLPADIAGWARSLQLRRIEMPPEIRDELLMIVAEARTT